MSLTCAGTRISNSAEAELVIEAVRLGHLALCKSRLSQAQRSEIRPGDVYVWLETPADATTGVPSLARWTDGHKWTTSKWKDDSLYYLELPAGSGRDASSSEDFSGAATPGVRQPSPPIDANQLIKQCYSIICDPDSEQRTHWHLTTYFTLASEAMLYGVHSGHIPCLLSITVPPGRYLSYKKFKASRRQSVDRLDDGAQSRRQTPRSSSSSTPSPTAYRQTLPSLTTIVPSRSAATPMLPFPTSSSHSSFTSVVSHAGASGNIHSRHTLQHGSWDMPLLPLSQLHNAHPTRHRCEVDRLQLAALDGCRSSVSQLPSAQMGMVSRLPSMSYVHH